MNHERFRQVRHLFDAVVEREPAEGKRFLDEAAHGDDELRREVEQLLMAHGQPFDLLDHPPAAPARSDGRLEGRRVGPYEVLRELGRGGMGTVYLASRADQVFRKNVAIKIVRPEVGNPEVVRRFQQEREILASLDHPGIARVLDGGMTEDGLPYLVMEFVEGQPIDRYCDERRLTINERIELFDQVCDAIHYAHSEGVIHRDLKPHNILVTGDGKVKLLDFGIAKLLRRGPEETTLSLTSDGMLLMTPEYASPEQVRGETIGKASDLYSLGVLLYELLTGRRPYRLSSRVYHEIMRVICEEPPTRPSNAVTRDTAAKSKSAESVEAISRARCGTPKELQRMLSGDLDNILLTALQKDPEKRYKTAEELKADLQRRLEGKPVAANAGRPLYVALSWIHRNQLALLLVGLLVLGLATGAVRLNKYGLLFVAVVIPSIACGYFLTRALLGAEIAKKRMRWFVKFMLAMFTFAILTASLPHAFWTMGMFVIVMSVYALGYLAAWPLRERWAGPLFLDLTRSFKEDWLIPSVIALGMLFQTPGIIANIVEAGPIPQLLSPVGIMIVMAVSLALANRAELREKGIICHCRLIRWNRIGSYTWQDGRGGRRMLMLNLTGGLLRFSPPLQIIVRPGRETQVNTVLERFLGEWPDQSAVSGA